MTREAVWILFLLSMAHLWLAIVLALTLPVPLSSWICGGILASWTLTGVAVLALKIDEYDHASY